MSCPYDRLTTRDAVFPSDIAFAPDELRAIRRPAPLAVDNPHQDGAAWQPNAPYARTASIAVPPRNTIYCRHGAPRQFANF
jgi:hypothetical protein